MANVPMHGLTSEGMRWSQDELGSMLALKSLPSPRAPVLSAAVGAGVPVAIAKLAVIVSACVLILLVILLAVLLDIGVSVNALIISI